MTWFIPESVFKAKRQRDETVGAETVLDEGETQVEKPVDQEEPEEVLEYEDDDGGGEVPVRLAKVRQLAPCTPQFYFFVCRTLNWSHNRHRLP